MSRVLVLNELIARHACALSCRHRTLAGWIAATLTPRWPVPIARQASRHTWPAFHQAVDQLVLHDDWSRLLQRLDAAGVQVHLVWGDRDPVGDPSYARRLARELANVSVQITPNADHTLPTAQPGLIVQLAHRPAGLDAPC